MSPSVAEHTPARGQTRVNITGCLEPSPLHNDPRIEGTLLCARDSEFSGSHNPSSARDCSEVCSKDPCRITVRDFLCSLQTLQNPPALQTVASVQFASLNAQLCRGGLFLPFMNSSEESCRCFLRASTLVTASLYFVVIRLCPGMSRTLE